MGWILLLVVVAIALTWIFAHRRRGDDVDFILRNMHKCDPIDHERFAGLLGSWREWIRRDHLESLYAREYGPYVLFVARPRDLTSPVEGLGPEDQAFEFLVIDQAEALYVASHPERDFRFSDHRVSAKQMADLLCGKEISFEKM